MALELKQNLKQTLGLHLHMTPQLQQAIRLLQLSRLELIDEINQEMEENPILEAGQVAEDVETGNGQAKEEEGPAPNADEFKEVQVQENIRSEIDWENYLGEYSSTPSAPNMHEYQDDAPSYENFVPAKTTMTDHLTWQWQMVDLTEQEHEIGLQIIGNLNADGYLKAELDEIGQPFNMPVSDVELVLKKVQELDPVGIAARDLKECLLIQLEQLELGESLAAQILRDHLPELERKNYQKIARNLKVSIEDVFAAERVILSLEPRPGRQYNNDEPQYISPDVYVQKVGSDFVVMLNEDGMPRLKVSQFYKDMLTNKEADQAKNYIQDKLRAATWLIRSIHQRQRTIFRVTESIVRFQREFLEKGVEYLRPLVLRDVAEDVELHESTISRVTKDKYVHTPQGIFELKFFFDSPISRFHGESLASESVKRRIKQIISAEDPKRPLSDKRIVEILQGANIDIARRTVAKYREMLGISSSTKRKKYY